MCDYCDCRTRPLLGRLGGDHERIVALVGRLRGAVEADRRAALADELRAVLGAHSRTEEAALYPELARAGVPTDALVAEHDEVDVVLRSAARDGVADRTLLLRALDGLEGHIHREEYDLFPVAHQVLDDAAWDRIEAVS